MFQNDWGDEQLTLLTAFIIFFMLKKGLEFVVVLPKKKIESMEISKYVACSLWRQKCSKSQLNGS